MIKLFGKDLKTIKYAEDEQIQKCMYQNELIWENKKWVHHTGTLKTITSSYSNGYSSRDGDTKWTNVTGRIRVVKITFTVGTDFKCTGDIEWATTSGYAMIKYTDGTIQNSSSKTVSASNGEEGQHVGETISNSTNGTFSPNQNKEVAQIGSHCNYGSGSRSNNGDCTARITEWYAWE